MCCRYDVLFIGGYFCLYLVFFDFGLGFLFIWVVDSCVVVVVENNELFVVICLKVKNIKDGCCYYFFVYVCCLWYDNYCLSGIKNVVRYVV